jgi:hypothetical protein
MNAMNTMQVMNRTNRINRMMRLYEPAPTLVTAPGTDRLGPAPALRVVWRVWALERSTVVAAALAGLACVCFVVSLSTAAPSRSTLATGLLPISAAQASAAAPARFGGDPSQPSASAVLAGRAWPATEPAPSF